MISMREPPKALTTVMIVDDDEIFLEELGEVLESSGYAMVTVNDPMQAIGVARSVRPKLILLDMKMPGKSGLEVAYEIQGVPELAGTPIIVTSAYVKKDNMPFLKACGIKKYLKKPFNPLDIIWQIEDVLKTNKTD